MHFQLCVHYIPFLKSVIRSLFNWVFKKGSIILVKCPSNVLDLRVLLRSIVNTDRLNPWLLCSQKRFAHSYFLSASLSRILHLLVKHNALQLPKLVCSPLAGLRNFKSVFLILNILNMADWGGKFNVFRGIHVNIDIRVDITFSLRPMNTTLCSCWWHYQVKIMWQTEAIILCL